MFRVQQAVIAVGIAITIMTVVIATTIMQKLGLQSALYPTSFSEVYPMLANPLSGYV